MFLRSLYREQPLCASNETNIAAAFYFTLCVTESPKPNPTGLSNCSSLLYYKCCKDSNIFVKTVVNFSRFFALM